jgi:hypothetical protein
MSDKPDTATAMVKGVPSPCSDGDAPVDCSGGGELLGLVTVGTLTVTLAELLADGVLERRGSVMMDASELGIGVSPGGIPMEPSDKVDPPVQRQCSNLDANTAMLSAHMGNTAP